MNSNSEAAFCWWRKHFYGVHNDDPSPTCCNYRTELKNGLSLLIDFAVDLLQAAKRPLHACVGVLLSICVHDSNPHENQAQSALLSSRPEN